MVPVRRLAGIANALAMLGGNIDIPAAAVAEVAANRRKSRLLRDRFMEASVPSYLFLCATNSNLRENELPALLQPMRCLLSIDKDAQYLIAVR